MLDDGTSTPPTASSPPSSQSSQKKLAIPGFSEEQNAAVQEIIRHSEAITALMNDQPPGKSDHLAERINGHKQGKTRHDGWLTAVQGRRYGAGAGNVEQQLSDAFWAVGESAGVLSGLGSYPDGDQALAAIKKNVNNIGSRHLSGSHTQRLAEACLMLDSVARVNDGAKDDAQKLQDLLDHVDEIHKLAGKLGIEPARQADFVATVSAHSRDEQAHIHSRMYY